MALVLVPLAACGEPDGSIDTLKGRLGLDALERRVADLDKRLSAMEKALPATESLRDDVRALEQRLAISEAKAPQVLETGKAAPLPPASLAVSPGGPAAPLHTERPDAAQRREQLTALSTEYRRKLADLATQRTQNASRLEHSAARRELRQWYIARRRAILRGQPLPD